jgi:hypothetical protein
MKETGLAVFAILVAYELLVLRGPGQSRLARRRAVVGLWPSGVLFLGYSAWAVWRLARCDLTYFDSRIAGLLGWHVPRNLLDSAAALFWPWPYHGTPPGLPAAGGGTALCLARLCLPGALALLALLHWRRSDQIAVWLFSWMVLVAVLPSFMLTMPGSRFSHPAVPAFAILLARAVGRVFDGLPTKAGRPWRHVLVAALSGYLFLHLAADIFSPPVRGYVRLSKECEQMAWALAAQAQARPENSAFILIDAPLPGEEPLQNAIANVIGLVYLPDRSAWIGVIRQRQLAPTFAGKSIPGDVCFLWYNAGQLVDVTNQVRRMADGEALLRRLSFFDLGGT